MLEIVPFKTVLYSDVLEYDKTLAEDIISISKVLPSVAFSNENGWQSESFSGRIENEKIKFIADQIQERMKSVYENYGIKKQPELANSWMNVNGRYDYNSSHKHPFSMFSAVFYLKTDQNSGDIVFRREDLLECFLKVDEFNEVNSLVHRFTPHDGFLLIFPSWLSHEVSMNKSDQIRVSMAFNYS